MELDPQLQKELLELFTAELNDRIQVMTESLLRLEKELDEETRQEVLDSIFRAAHSVKGSAWSVGVTDVGEIAHHMESLFSQLRQQNTAPAPEVIDLCLHSLDRLRDGLQAFTEHKPVEFDLPDLTNRLAHYAAGKGGGEPLIERQPSEVQPQEGKEEKASKLTGVPLAVDTASEAEAPTEEKAASGIRRESGAETIRISVEKLERVSALAEELQVTKIEMDDHLDALQRLRAEMRTFAGLWTQSAGFWKGREDLELPERVKQLLGSSMDTVTELNHTTERMHEEMRTSSNQLGLLSTSLEKDVRLMRLMPASTLLRPLARSVRDIARELGKKVNFEIIGDEIGMDRAVLEGIRDPLIHMLRNAVDHGLEKPEERRALGKPEVGRLTVRLHSTGNQIAMTVEDDGAGMRAHEIAEIAQKKKLLSAAQLETMGKEEILDLIFRPGFSAKEMITDVSGRGVGLDVVRTNLRSLKGSVRVDTREGEGTTFVLQLPLTLATEHGLQIRCGGGLYVIPTTSVKKVIELERDEIVEVEASQAVLLEDRAIPLRDLATVLEVEPREPASYEKLPVVVISSGWRTIAFLVEEIIGEREIVLKPLLPPLVSVRNVSGGTLTGSGEIIVVLNGPGLVDSALRPGAKSHVLERHGESQEARCPHILVVDDSITTRTLETNILVNIGYEVSVAVDGKQAWEQMQEADFDLVVTDVDMPIMDGFELTERIKQSEQFGEMPVIIVTSLAKEADRRRGIEVGADAYIVKGQFETKALLDVVSQLV